MVLEWVLFAVQICFTLEAMTEFCVDLLCRCFHSPAFGMESAELRLEIRGTIANILDHQNHCQRMGMT